MQNNFGSDQKYSSWFHSFYCYCIYYMRKYSVHVKWGQSTTSLENVSKNFYEKQFTTVTTHKNVQN